MNIGTEQLIHDLELRHVSLRKEHESLRADRDRLQAKVKYDETVSDELRESVQKFSRQLADREIDCKRKDNTIRELEESNEDMRDRLNRRSDECERLRDDLKSQAEQLLTQQGRLRDALNTLSELQGQQLPMQYEITKISRENEILQNRIQYTEKELEEKNNEFLKIRRETVDKIFELESQLSTATSEKQILVEKQKLLEDQILIQNDRINGYMNQIREFEINAANEKDSFLHELEAQKRLVDLYKKYFDEATLNIEERDQEIQSLKDTHIQRLNQLQSKHQAEVDDLKKLMEDIRNESEKQIRLLEEAGKEQNIMAAATTAGTTSTSAAANTAIATIPLDYDGLSVTDMYDRVIAIESELGHERARRKELEIYLNRVLKDVESKAPLITAQRRDYHRVLESHEKLSSRLTEVLKENSIVHKDLQSMQSRCQFAEEETRALNLQNKDLSAQLQHLLKKSIEGKYGSLPDVSEPSKRSSSTPSDVISEHLVTFNDIIEIQTRNIQLLRTIRKISDDDSKLEEQKMTTNTRSNANRIQNDTSDVEDTDLQVALKELHNMRETRQRMEDMVNSLVQQRDMYRAMLEEADMTIAAKSSAAAASASTMTTTTTPTHTAFAMQSPTSRSMSTSSTPLQITSGSPMTPQQSTAAGMRLQDLQNKIIQLEDEKSRLLDRMNRIEDTEKVISQALEKEKTENSKLRMEAAHATAEARFQSSRASSLEQSLTTTQLTLDSVVKKRSELEGLLVSHQKEVRHSEERFHFISDSLRSVQENLRRSETALEGSKNAELRLISQLSDAREELQKQRVLTDAMLRIEAGLTGRVEEDKATLIRERDTLLTTLESTKKDSSNRILILEQRVCSMEEELRTSRMNNEQREKEASSIREQYLLEQSTSKAAQERSNLLERQLNDLQNRFDQIQGHHTVSTITSIDTAQTELALERAVAEIESLTSQLRESQGHAEQFRRISSTTEHMLKELRERSTSTKEAQEQEILQLSNQIHTLKTELDEKRQAYMASIQDSETAREALSTATIEFEMKIKSIEIERNNAQQMEKQVLAQMEILRQDAMKYQQSARSSHANYERELQLHAQASTTVKTLEDEIDRIQIEISTYQQNLADQSASMIQKENAYEEEKKRLSLECNELKTKVEDLQRTNDLLHSQVQSLGAQVDKFHTSRIDNILTPSPISTSTSTSTAAVSDENTVSTVEEINELRKTSVELREVVRFMKRERDTLEAKLNIAQNENTRHINAISTYQRSIDDLKAELKHEMEKHVSTRDENEFARIMSEVTQLNIVRESNAHLRAENENLARQVHQLTESLHKTTEENIPLQDTIRQLETIKTVLEAERDSMKKDAIYWKDRLHQLVSRYNDVDPEEHRLLITKLDAANQSIVTLQENLKKIHSEKNLSDITMKKELEAKDTEINSFKARFESSEKASDGLRNLLRQKNQSGKEIEKKAAELSREIRELTQRNVELQQTVLAQTSKLQQQHQTIIQQQQAAATASTMSVSVPTPVPSATTIATAAVAPISSAIGSIATTEVPTATTTTSDMSSLSSSGNATAVMMTTTTDTSSTVTPVLSSKPVDAVIGSSSTRLGPFSHSPQKAVPVLSSAIAGGATMPALASEPTATTSSSTENETDTSERALRLKLLNKMKRPLTEPVPVTDETSMEMGTTSTATSTATSTSTSLETSKGTATSSETVTEAESAAMTIPAAKRARQAPRAVGIATAAAAATTTTNTNTTSMDIATEPLDLSSTTTSTTTVAIEQTRAVEQSPTAFAAAAAAPSQEQPRSIPAFAPVPVTSRIARLNVHNRMKKPETDTTTVDTTTGTSAAAAAAVVSVALPPQQPPSHSVTEERHMITPEMSYETKHEEVSEEKIISTNLNPQAAEYIPTMSTHTTAAPADNSSSALSIETISSYESIDRNNIFGVATTTSSTASEFIPAPPTTSPFLDIKPPPSPSSSTGKDIKLVFGGKPSE
eukprot:gene7955-16288_t